jgi:hypothetical protein
MLRFVHRSSGFCCNNMLDPLACQGFLPIIEACSRSSESRFRFPTHILTHRLLACRSLVCIILLIVLSLGQQYNHLYSFSVCSLSRPIFCHHSFVILSGLSIQSSSASNTTSCVFKHLRHKSLFPTKII